MSATRIQGYKVMSATRLRGYVGYKVTRLQGYADHKATRLCRLQGYKVTRLCRYKVTSNMLVDKVSMREWSRAWAQKSSLDAGKTSSMEVAHLHAVKAHGVGRHHSEQSPIQQRDLLTDQPSHRPAETDPTIGGFSQAGDRLALIPSLDERRGSNIRTKESIAGVTFFSVNIGNR